MKKKAYDFLVVGGGIMGLTLARALSAKYPDVRLAIIEKEKMIGFHASGRNSGVLHSGFYYTAESLKARFTQEGNKAMKEYCAEHRLPVYNCGKVVVATSDNDLQGIEELKRRGDANKIPLRWINEQETAAIDPSIHFYKKALYSPTTATVNPLLICQTMAQELSENAVDILYGTGYTGKTENGISTTQGPVNANVVINTAGLYADKIAQDYGFGRKYTLLPFKGLYLKSTGPLKEYRTNIYPVPDMANPFLGVHFTATVDRHIKIGPTAIPAFWRENYQWLSRFSLSEFLEILYCGMRLFWKNEFQFRSLAFEELKKCSRNYLIYQAAKMVRKMDSEQFKVWADPGIRAQLYDKEKGRLVQDFIVEGDKKSWHVLNAVSPAFTCSIPFSQWIVNRFTSN